MAGSVYTYVGNAEKRNATASLTTAQGVVGLAASGLFLSTEYQSLIGEGILLVPGPARSPASQLSAPSVVAGAAGSPNGAYRYVVTFVTAAGETAAGPETAQVTLSNQQGSLSNIPIGSALSGVTARKIYRTQAGGQPGTEKLVATINNNTATTFIDNVADGSLGALAPSSDTAAVLPGTPTPPSPTPEQIGALDASNNLADAADIDTARANLHVPSLTPAQCVALANVASLSGSPTIDGYALQPNDVVLLTAQTTASQNGPWQVPASGTGLWNRPDEFSSGFVTRARTIAVINGANAGTTWLLKVATGTIVVDTDAQVWTSSASIARSLLEINIKDPQYGIAAGDVLDGTGTISAGSLGQLTISHPARPSGLTTLDLFKKVIVFGGGAVVNNGVSMLGIPHVTTIQSVAGGVGTLAVPAAQAVAGARVLWGTDDSTVIALADAAAQLAGKCLAAPSGGYFVHNIGARVKGADDGTTFLYRLPDKTIGGTNYALGNYLPVLGNPQALAPSGSPDSDWSAEDLTIDGLMDPNTFVVKSSGTFTVTIANPAVFTRNGHGLLPGDPVTFTTTGALPTGLVVGTLYYVIAAGLTANTFQVAAALNGSAIVTTGVQSGVHTINPQASRPWCGLQGNGVDIYALQRGHTKNVRVQHFAYAGVEVASNRSGSEHNDGTGNSGIQKETGPSGANLKEPQPVGNLEMTGRLEVVDCGFQWGPYGAIDDGYKINGAIVQGATSAVVCADASRNAPYLNYIFPGQRIALGAAGIVPPETPSNNGYETITVDRVDLGTNTVYFATATQYAHADLTPFGAVNYWGDPGFGCIIRQPARDITISVLVADRCGWGGLSIGQAQNYKYDPLRIGGLTVDRVRIKRSGVQGAPLMKLGFQSGPSIGGGYVGDPGGYLYDAAVAGDKVIVLRTSEGRRFYNGELINVGIPGAATMEAASVQRAITYHTATADATGGSSTLANVSGTWIVGEKIQGNQIPPNSRVTGPGAQGTVLTNPVSMTISNACTGSNMTGMPIQGGDSLVLCQPLAFAHAVNDDVFFFCGTSAGVALQEVGFTSGRGARVEHLEIEHCYDGVQTTSRSTDLADPSSPENRRHVLTGIHSIRNIRHGFNTSDAKNVVREGCFAWANGGTGFLSTTSGYLANDGYNFCQAWSNGTDWNLTAGTYTARGCLGLADNSTMSYVKLSANGTWTVPVGVTLVRLRAMSGAGGGGGGGSPNSGIAQAGGGGGSGGHIVDDVFAVNPGDVLTFTKGTGGVGGAGGAAGGNPGSDGGNGTASSVVNTTQGTTLITTGIGSKGKGSAASSTAAAGGGIYGTNGSNGTGAANPAGSGSGSASNSSTAMLSVVGGAGGGAATATLGGGGGAAQTTGTAFGTFQAAGGSGASATTAGINGVTATRPGCGGGGAGGGANGGAGGTGGAGADGQLEIWW